MDERYDHKHDPARAMVEAGSGHNRRGLLAAAGGFALAASGLLMPRWLDVADAREGALGGKRGGSHTKHRSRHRRRHSPGDKRDKRKAPGAPQFFRTSALTTKNGGCFGVTDQNTFVTFYHKIKSGLDDYEGPWIQDGNTGSLNQFESQRDTPGHYRVGALITNVAMEFDLFIDVRNISFDFPMAQVSQGLSLDPPAGKTGTTLIRMQRYDQDEQHKENLWAKDRQSRATVYLVRKKDTDFIEFEFSIDCPACFVPYCKPA